MSDLNLPIESGLASPDKDRLLREDIRLLGRLLGETVREQERTRFSRSSSGGGQHANRFNREQDPRGAQQMAAALDGLSLGTTVSVVRAFSYFLHLANIAEDRHHVRRNRAHTRAGSPPREGCLARTLERLAGAGIDGARLEACLEAALVSPDLTAHPTAVQCKRILALQRQFAALLDRRDRLELTPAESDETDAGLTQALRAHRGPAGDPLGSFPGRNGA